MAKLDGKIALISGGTSGIGAETARLFKSEGATVIVTGSSQKSVDAAKDDLPGIEVVVSNAGDIAATKTLVDQVKAKHGRIDVLFVNAGIAHFAPLEAVDEAFFDKQFDVNVKGAYFLVKHAAAAIPEGGSIILTASSVATRGGANMTVYAATKAAVRALGRAFAAELAPRKVRVNILSPGPIETPIFGKSGLGQAQIDGFLKDAETRVPMGRIGQPGETARAALYLAADATFTTGSEVHVDGGLVEI